ncbi:MAG: NAD(P)H-hydrate dehydratase [Lachnospiraceae bacterium]|nr:NAD(P)H-hydrate dehydratase [Lachnospiraceae bacterium]
MIPILTAKKMQEADRQTIEELGIPQAVLMERAALVAYQVIEEVRDPSSISVLIVCGPGNNGGDGVALARILSERDIYPDVYLPGKEDSFSDGLRQQLEILRRIYPDTVIRDTAPDEVYDVVVDALFGISLNRKIEGVYREAVDYINNAHSLGAYILSLDIATGIDSSTGQIQEGSTVQADRTVAFASFKVGHLLFPGAMYSGEVTLKDIGIPSAAMEQDADIHIFHDDEISMPPRRPYTNKGSYGKILVVAGSKGMAGAAVLCAEASMRSGSGMVQICTDESNRQIVQTALPEAIVSTYDKKIDEKGLLHAIDWCDAIAIGPGLSDSPLARDILSFVIKNSDVPVVVDADALNIISSNADILADASADIIVTPHLGEMARLTGISVEEISAHLMSTAIDFSKSYGVITVLKDARTIIASPKGEVIINTNGNNGMATAGSGDVLTGMIASIRGRIPDSFMAAAIGCALHGRAGDDACHELGADHMLAGDIIKHIR